MLMTEEATLREMLCNDLSTSQWRGVRLGERKTSSNTITVICESDSEDIAREDRYEP